MLYYGVNQASSGHIVAGCNMEAIPYLVLSTNFIHAVIVPCQGNNKPEVSAATVYAYIAASCWFK